MSSWVVPRRVNAQGAELAGVRGEEPDNLLGRLTKYVPAPLLTLYASAYAFLVSLNLHKVTARWALAIIGIMAVIACVAWIRKKAPQGVVKQAHLIVTPIAFVVWAYTISASLLGDWFIGWLALVGQVGVALLAWVMEPTEVQDGNAGEQRAGAPHPAADNADPTGDH